MVNSSIRAAELEHSFVWALRFSEMFVLPDFMFLGQTLNSAVVSTLNFLYEAKYLEIKKNETKPSPT